MLYHLTTKDKLAQISKEGLVPRIGSNSELIGEDIPYVYLSSREDLPYWKILLDRDILLQVDDSDIIRKTDFSYGDYSEVMVDSIIPPNKLTLITKPIIIESELSKAMKYLCIHFTASICFTVLTVIRYYYTKYDNLDGGYTYSEEDILNSLNSCITVCNRLDFSQVTKTDLREELSYLGEECAYTFVDTYLDTDRRLYEMLMLFPIDDLFEKRKELYNIIIKNFDGCLDVNTGGWTG